MDESDFAARMNDLAMEVDATGSDLDARYRHPSMAGQWLADVQCQMGDALTPTIPADFHRQPLLEQIQLSVDMQRRTFAAQTMLSLTSAAMKGTQKSAETILNQKG